MDTIDGRVVRLRPLGQADAAAVRRVLAAPEVRRWWGDPDEQVRDVLTPAEDTSRFAIEVAGETVGVIECHEELTPGFRHASIDIAVHPDQHGRGIGSDAVYTLARQLVDVRGHHRLTIDPAAANATAIRVYRGLGFRPVGVLRAYQRFPDGSWHDGLLMDVLADELVSPGQPRPPDPTDVRTVTAEVEAQHTALERWLGTAAGPEVLDGLLAAHAADFTLVTTAGEVLTATQLADQLAGAGNTAPGLRIEVTDVHLAAAHPHLVVTRFTEHHRDDGGTSCRLVTAVLTPDPTARNGLRWQSVHETAAI